MSYNLVQLREDLQKKNSQQLLMVGTNWGKSGWNFLYNIALSGNGSTEDIHNLLNNIGPVLPCKECITHYEQFISNNILPCNHADMFEWLQKLENTIAKKKYGRDYKFINRYRQIQKISLIKYTNKNGNISVDPNCKTCYQNKNKNRKMKSTNVIKISF